MKIDFENIKTNEEAVAVLQYCVRFFHHRGPQDTLLAHHLNMIQYVQRYLCPDVDPNEIEKVLAERESVETAAPEEPED